MESVKEKSTANEAEISPCNGCFPQRRDETDSAQISCIYYKYSIGGQLNSLQREPKEGTETRKVADSWYCKRKSYQTTTKQQQASGLNIYCPFKDFLIERKDILYKLHYYYYCAALNIILSSLGDKQQF